MDEKERKAFEGDAFAQCAMGDDYFFEAFDADIEYKDVLYKCVQAHTSQIDWSPDKTPALWAKAGDPAVEYPEWSQPVGAHDAYMTGDKVSHSNKNWISIVDSNVWEPGVYGWNEVTE